MEKLRKDMNPEFCWDLSAIYENKQAWEETFTRAADLVKEIPAVAGTLAASAADLKSGLDKIYTAAEIAERVC